MKQRKDVARVESALEACILQRLSPAAVLNLKLLEDDDRFWMIDRPIHDASVQFVIAHVSHWVDSVNVRRQFCRSLAETS
jgi:hypothetical protein